MAPVDGAKKLPPPVGAVVVLLGEVNKFPVVVVAVGAEVVVPKYKGTRGVTPAEGPNKLPPTIDEVVVAVETGAGANKPLLVKAFDAVLGAPPNNEETLVEVDVVVAGAPVKD